MAHTSILIFGHDGTLLQTRQWVLEKAGFEVLTVSALSAAVAELTAQSHQLVVLCHTLTSDERHAVTRTATTLEPSIKTLTIVTERQQSGEKRVVGDVLDSLAGARALIDAARKVLR